MKIQIKILFLILSFEIISSFSAMIFPEITYKIWSSYNVWFIVKLILQLRSARTGICFVRVLNIINVFIG